MDNPEVGNTEDFINDADIMDGEDMLEDDGMLGELMDGEEEVEPAEL